jgi:lauroyl/myristoyl acyltransferase
MSDRKSFVFSPDASERLERLRVACRLSNQSNVIRLSLMVLEDLIEAVKSGKTIVIQDKKGEAKPYHPLLE